MHRLQQPWEGGKRVRGDDWSQPVLLEFDVQDKDSLGDFYSLCWQDGVLLNESAGEHRYAFVPAPTINMTSVFPAPKNGLDSWGRDLEPEKTNAFDPN